MAKTHNQFVDELKSVNPSIEVIGRYTKSTERVKVRCRICGKEWTPLAYSLSAGKGCPHCSALKGAMNNQGKTGTKGLDSFIKELQTISPEIEVLGKYVNNKTPIECHCSRCGTTWKARPNALLRGHGCPRCAKSGTSFMEQFILLCFQHALGEGKVISRDKTVIGMELDIFIPDRQLAIEPGNWYLHQRWLDRDKLKREKCKDKGIRLITVYDQYSTNTPAPFKDDCITFSDDYNSADHKHIRQLVDYLFSVAHVDANFSEEEYEQITQEAYSRSLSRTHEQFIKELSSIAPTIEVLGKYVNANRRLLVRCSICGHEWNAVPANLLAGDGCRKCGTKKAHEKFMKTQEEYVAEVKEINPSIEVIGTYTGRHSPIRAKCLICGYEWTTLASNLLRGSSHKGAKAIHKSLNNKRK